MFLFIIHALSLHSEVVVMIHGAACSRNPQEIANAYVGTHSSDIYADHLFFPWKEVHLVSFIRHGSYFLCSACCRCQTARQTSCFTLWRTTSGEGSFGRDIKGWAIRN